MSYTPNIPQGADDPSQSQGQLLANFQALNTFLSVNHVSLNDAQEGKHTFLQMPEQGSAPSTALDEGALYTKEAGGTSQLFYRRESNGSELQLTGGAVAATNGSITFAGGIIIKWGLTTFPGGVNFQLVTYPTPFLTTGYVVLATAIQGPPPPTVGVTGTSSPTNFTITMSSTAAISVNWIAIGS